MTCMADNGEHTQRAFEEAALTLAYAIQRKKSLISAILPGGYQPQNRLVLVYCRSASSI